MDLAIFEGQNLLVLQDGNSKWPEFKILTRTNVSSLIETLRTLFAAYGLPEEVVSDNGPPFTSETLANYFKRSAVVHTFTPTYHPQSNGSAERTIRSVKESLRQQLLDPSLCKRSLQHKIDAWSFDYLNTPHTTTGVSPAELFLGRRPRTPLSLLQPSNLLKWKMREVKEKRMAADRGKVTVFRVGDLVWVKSVTHQRLNWLPGITESAVSSVSYRVICNNRVPTGIVIPLAQTI
jgi:transposase InsO family protein